MRNDALVRLLSQIMSKPRTLLGGGLIIIALAIILATFMPLYLQEIGYYYNTLFPAPIVESKETQDQKEGDIIVPKDKEFGVVIPKIRANSIVHQDVDWRDPAVYQKVLQTGVAHAEGTSTPDKPGNMFLFAHSGVDFYEAVRYNAEFYLLGKLEVGDEITVFYQQKPYLYHVTEIKKVAPSEIEYLQKDASNNKPTLTLMTCWPAGTTFKRLLVIAEM